MTDPRSDAQLVTDHLAGDRSALAAVFDRFGPGLFDTAAAMTGDRHDAADLLQDVFVTAAEKLGQLRDPERLKPWLYAVLRNEVYRRTRRRSRTRPVDFSSPDVPEMAAPVDPQADAEMVAYSELAELVRSAAAGLDERDQLMVELSVRQGLQGADLAAALGVTPEQSYTLVHRMRERVERSLGALVVARAGRRDCAELASILGAWNGEFTILIRKRVARHVDACSVCENTRRRVAPMALLGAAPAMAMPVGLRDRVLAATGSAPTGGASSGTRRVRYQFDAPGGFPGKVSSGTRFVAWLVAAAVVLIVALGSAVVLQATRPDDTQVLGPDPVTTVATAPSDVTTLAPDTSTSEDPPPSGPTTSAPTTSTSSTTSTTSTTIVAESTTLPVGVPPTVAPPGSTSAPTTAVTTPPTNTTATTVPATTTAPTTTTLVPGRLSVSSTSLDLGGRTGTGSVIVTNVGGTAVTWGVSGDPAPFTMSASPGALGPGQSSTIVFGFDRSSLAEGDWSSSVTVTGPGGTTISLRAAVEHTPVVGGLKVSPNPSAVCVNTNVSVSIFDESSVTVVLSWSGPTSGSLTMTSGRIYTGSTRLGFAGDYTLTVKAVDSRGNTATNSASVRVDTCIG